MQPVAANGWQDDVEKLLAVSNPHGQTMLKDGRAPQAGETMRLPLLAKTFKVLVSYSSNHNVVTVGTMVELVWFYLYLIQFHPSAINWLPASEL